MKKEDNKKQEANETTVEKSMLEEEQDLPELKEDEHG